MAFVHGNAEIIADKPGGIEYFIFHQIRIGAKNKNFIYSKTFNQWPLDMPIYFAVSSFLAKICKLHLYF